HGITDNRYCETWLSAASIVANRIAAGEATIAIAGGVESISLVQFNLNMNDFFYAPLQQRMPAVWWTMNQTADFVAKKYGISREAQDAYVVQSQARVAAAAAAGKFAEEIVPFTTTMKITDKVTTASHEQEVTLDRDEGPRPDTTLAGLAALKPVYPGGTTTAGNASQLSDGAGAVVMMDADIAARRGLPILGLFRGMQLAAVAPEEMSIAIAPAIRKLVKHHQLAMSDVDLWELHEAYAVTTLYNQAQLETPWEITNVNGGAVPLGHPYGMSGIRYVGSTLLVARRHPERPRWRGHWEYPAAGTPAGHRRRHRTCRGLWAGSDCRRTPKRSECFFAGTSLLLAAEVGALAHRRGRRRAGVGYVRSTGSDREECRARDPRLQ